MKSLLLLVLFVFGIVQAQADDIVANGDFADGKAHWKGDVRDSAEQDANDMSSLDHPAASTGIIITLNGSWTKAYQVFNTRENALDYSVTYKLSPDCSLNSNRGMVPGGASLTDILQSIVGLPLQKSFDHHLGPGEWLVVIADLTQNLIDFSQVKLGPPSSNPQTATGTIPKLAAHEEKTLYLAFPPGTGTVTLLKVALTPTASAASTVAP